MCQLRRLGIPLAALGVALLLEGCEGILAPVGPVGSGERTILLNALAIMLAIVIPTMLATVTFAWWFRASNRRARYLPTWAYSGRLELIIWSIPALVVFFLGGIAWISSHELDPSHPLPGKEPPVEIDVVSLDWKWLFIYPREGVASVNRLVIPTGVPLHLRITSATVMNVFFVPRLGSEIYTMYGMQSQLNLQADEPGEYPGLAAHFSGDGFSDMSFQVHAVAAPQFAAWAASTHSSGGPALDEAAYRLLLRQTQKVKPYTYPSIDPGLFEAVLMQKLPSGDGPPSPQSRPVATAEN
jgi:cytochrome o ubiquinol oxidase subunit II